MSRLVPLALAILAFSPPLHAQVADTDPQVRAAVTYFDLDGGATSAPAAEVTFLGKEPRVWRASLMAGALASTHGQVYIYGGLHLPIQLPLGLLARPSFSVGLYEKGSGRELGNPLEFRSSLAIERMVGDRFRALLFVYHLSNAGLGFTNPGLEALGLGLSFPLGR